MSLRKTVLPVTVSALAVIPALHLTFNLHVFSGLTGNESFRVGFLPVTCHLTCPVTDFINKQVSGRSEFQPLRFQGWPELKEAFLSGETPATFILAPLAMKLREDGVSLRIVYLGHRDGSAMMVNKDSAINSIDDLKGKTVAVPNRFSNQWLLVIKALKEHNLSPTDVHMIEMPPPDMPAALFSHAVDAITSGGTFTRPREVAGCGRRLYLTKDV